MRLFEFKPVSEGTAVKQFAKHESFKLLYDMFRMGKSVSNLYCMRELLTELRANQSKASELEKDFFQHLKDQFEGQPFEPRILFDSVIELSRGRGERRLMMEAILRNLDIFDEQTQVALKEAFEIKDIVFVTPEYRGVAMAGGIATMVSDLCECLAEMGYKVSVIIPYYHLNK